MSVKNLLSKLAMGKRGQMEGAAKGFLGVIIILVLIAIGSYLVFSILNNVPTTGLTPEQNSTMQQISDSAGSTLEFATIIPFVGIAVVVLAIVATLYFLFR